MAQLSPLNLSDKLADEYKAECERIKISMQQGQRDLIMFMLYGVLPSWWTKRNQTKKGKYGGSGLSS